MLIKSSKKKRPNYQILSLIALALLYCLLSVSELPASEEEQEAKTIIRGCIKTKDEKPLNGIVVKCFYIDPKYTSYEFVWEEGSQLSDEKGQYKFQIVKEGEYRIQAGGKKVTSTQSEKFLVLPNKEVIVEDLIVRPYSTKISGNVGFKDGKPAANLAYGYLSENCSPVDPENPPKTNTKGEFTIDYLLPDELYSFWVFTDTNVFRVWKRLDPNIPTLQLTLKKSDCIELPEDWLYGGYTHEAIARNMGYAENSIIDFKLPDLNGKTISISDNTFKNKAVIVNIMGTWCGGCKQEVPYLVKFYDKYKNKGLEIISISFERTPEEEALKLVSDFKKKNKINYTMLYGGISDKENVESVIKGLKLFDGYPTTIYIGRDGKVQFMHAGFWIHTDPHKKWQLDLMENHINEILVDVNSSK